MNLKTNSQRNFEGIKPGRDSKQSDFFDRLLRHSHTRLSTTIAIAAVTTAVTITCAGCSKKQERVPIIAEDFGFEPYHGPRVGHNHPFNIVPSDIRPINRTDFFEHGEFLVTNNTTMEMYIATKATNVVGQHGYDIIAKVVRIEPIGQGNQNQDSVGAFASKKGQIVAAVNGKYIFYVPVTHEAVSELNTSLNLSIDR